jgi:hypothetical protein
MAEEVAVIRRCTPLLSNRGMPRRILLAPHLTADELYARYRQACEPVVRSRRAVLGTSSGSSHTAHLRLLSHG